jgi:hypothetical protein
MLGVKLNQREKARYAMLIRLLEVLEGKHKDHSKQSQRKVLKEQRANRVSRG